MKIPLSFCFLVSLAFGPFAHAGSLTYVGFDENQPGSWRTKSADKALDVDKNDVYGSDGYFLPGAGLEHGYEGNKTDWVENSASLTVLPKGMTIEVSQAVHAEPEIDFGIEFGGPMIDDPEGDGKISTGRAFAWIWADEASMLTFNPGRYFPIKGLRVGVLIPTGKIGKIGLKGDGESAMTDVVDNGGLAWYFFDVEDWTIDEPFDLCVSRRAPIDGLDPTFLAVSFDAIP